MAKLNRSMQEYLRTDRPERIHQQKKVVTELSDYCKNYLKAHRAFDWFIEKYYGKKKVIELWELAEQNKESELFSDLNSIWFELPDHIFNIQNNPTGWETFLTFVEE